jgi:hypothetical protein
MLELVIAFGKDTTNARVKEQEHHQSKLFFFVFNWSAIAK